MSNNLPKFTIAQMLEAGVHFGHRTSRWNPKMAPYIYGEKNGIHIINLQKSAPLFYNALNAAYKVSQNNGRILFVSTKKQASDIVAETAARCGQYYVNHRWLGGMLTNWKTVSQSIKRLDRLEEQLADDSLQLKKEERLAIARNVEKLQKALGGIRHMSGLPDLIVVIDVAKEKIAIEEANVLGIPVVAVVDTNCSPEGVDFVVPGNDDATRSIEFYCNTLADASLLGLERAMAASNTEEKATPTVSLEKAEAKTEEVADVTITPAEKTA